MLIERVNYPQKKNIFQWQIMEWREIKKKKELSMEQEEVKNVNTTNESEDEIMAVINVAKNCFAWSYGGWSEMK